MLQAAVNETKSQDGHAKRPHTPLPERERYPLSVETPGHPSLTGNGNSIPPSAAARSRSAAGSLQRLYGNQAVLQMRNSSGGPPVPSVPLRPSQSGILQRKCECGGAAGMSGECEECSTQRLGLQTKLKVSEPGDIYEQEADRIADQVMATPAHHAVSGAPPRIQRFSGQSNGQMDAAPASVDRVLAGSGRPLEPALRRDMEQRFGYDFSRVRVHTDARAVESARAVSARAYTVGRDIIFAVGQYAPDSKHGRKLLAHELTHTIQQSAVASGAISPHDPITIEPVGIAFERTAEESASRLTTNSGALAPTPRLALQRAPALPDEIGLPAEYAFALDKRKRTWRRYARSEGQKDAARIRKSGKLSPEERQEVNAKLDFFEGEAREVYIREIRPTLLRVTPPEHIEMPETYKSYVGKLPVAEGEKVIRRRRYTIRFFSKIKDYQLEEAYISRLQRYLDEGLEANEHWDLETIEQIVQERAPTAPWHAKARQEFLAKLRAQEQARDAKLQAQEQARERQKLLSQAPEYWQNQMGALSEQTRGWPKEVQDLAQNLLWKWYELRKKAFPPNPALAIHGIEGSIEATIRKDLVSQFEVVLRAAERQIQAECDANRPGTLMKMYGDPCKRWFETPGGRGYQALLQFERQLIIFRDKDGVPYRTVVFWVEKLLKQPVPTSMGGRHLELLEAWALVGQAFNLAASWSATFKPVAIRAAPPVTPVRPPTAPPVSGLKPIPANVRGGTPPPGAPPARVEPAGAATDSRIPPFPRRDLIRGQFPASPAAPAAPAPARPVTPPITTGRTVVPPASVKPMPPVAPARPPTAPPARAVVAPAPVKPMSPVAPVKPVTGLRGWLFGTKLKLAIEGVEVSGAAPRIGAGGATGSARPTPAVIVKTTPPPAAPTPAPLPPASTPPRAVSPKIVTPSAPSRPTTTRGAVGVPAPVTPAPPAATGRTVGPPAPATPLPGVATAKAVVGTTAPGTGFNHDQILDLFIRHFQRPGPPQGTIVIHPTQASFEAAAQAAGFLPGRMPAGFFHNNLVHLPPTASTLTAMHESLHMIGRQSGVGAMLGRYVEEGLTEWLARSLGPEAGRRVYDDNVAFVRLLANIVHEDTLRLAYLHCVWGPLREALRARLGGDADVEHFYRLLRRVGPHGENGWFLGDAIDMLWPASE